MKIGASSACFYPLETEKSFEKLCNMGFDTVELFVNSPSEIQDDFLSLLLEIRNKYGVNIISIHPFSSFAETGLFFSTYERRFLDALPFYDAFLRAAGILGAKYFVVHGCRSVVGFDDEEYFRRFKILCETGRKYGVSVCQENVVQFKSQSPQFLLKMREYLQDEFKMVFDIKQAYRSGYTYSDFFEPLHESIVHLHLSDHNEKSDCIVPMSGNFPYNQFFSDIKRFNIKADCVIEVYEWSYTDESEITASRASLETVAGKILF